jgi:hypothetical protein
LGTSCLGCAAKPDGIEETTLVDSAGIKIVASNASKQPDTILTVHQSPMVTFGASDDAPMLRVRGAVRLSDGTVVVANSGFHELLYF